MAVLLVATVVLLQSTAIEAQADDRWLGTWFLNLAKSVYVPGPAPYKRGTWTIERAGEALKMTYDLVAVRGGVTHMEWSGRLDGAAYRLQGPDVVVTYAYTQMDALTLDLVVTIDGIPSVSGRVVRSVDGRSITATTSSRNARGEAVTTKSVYEKR